MTEQNEKNEEVIFVCAQYPYHEIVVSPMGRRDAHGNKIPSKRIIFRPFGGGGYYKTSDPKEIELIKKNDLFLSGVIREEPLAALELNTTKSVPVTVGAKGEVESVPQSEAGRSRKINAVKTPKA